MARTSARTLEQWRELIQGWPGSGLTQAEYCDRHDISVSRFHRWRERLCQEPNAVEARLAGGGSQPPRLLPVPLRQDPSTPRQDPAVPALTRVFPNGLRLEIGADVAPSTLAPVLDLVSAHTPA
jgi:hypothetical protein